MEVKSIKESILEEMPIRPVKKFEFDERYGSRAGRALIQLVESGDLVRIKRGLYSLSDERLDERSYEGVEEELVFLPTEELILLVRSFYSQFDIGLLLEEGQEGNLKKVGYFKRSIVGKDNVVYTEKKNNFVKELGKYRLSEEGIDIINNI